MIYYDTYWHSTTISFAQSPMASNAPIMPTSDPTTTEDVSHPEGEEARDEEEALRAYLPALSGKQIRTRTNPASTCSQAPTPSLGPQAVAMLVIRVPLPQTMMVMMRTNS